jgi:hypothetical protein
MHVNERDKVALVAQQRRKQKTCLGLRHPVTEQVHLYQNILDTDS